MPCGPRCSPSETCPRAADAEFDSRTSSGQEYDEIVDAPTGIDNEEEDLTAVRTGRSAIVASATQRRLWGRFQAFNRLLQKRGLLTFEGTVHQVRLIVRGAGSPVIGTCSSTNSRTSDWRGCGMIAALSRTDEDADNPLCMAGDGHQRINRHSKVPLSRAGINVVGRSRRLKINYRTSEQIRRVGALSPERDGHRRPRWWGRGYDRRSIRF